MREPVVPQFDAETYLLWESRQHERFELHSGFVLPFAGGTLDHDRIARNLCNAFDTLFPPPCRSFGSDVKVRADAQTFFYPDSGVVCEGVTGNDTVVTQPRLVCEVLSTSTRSYDIVEKRAAYRGMGSLHAYVIVHTDFQRIEVDLRNADGTWRTSVFDGDPIPLGTGLLTFEAVYRGTSLVDWP
jgi:Uma2 family endonuclease